MVVDMCFLKTAGEECHQHTKRVECGVVFLQISIKYEL